MARADRDMIHVCVSFVESADVKHAASWAGLFLRTIMDRNNVYVRFKESGKHQIISHMVPLAATYDSVRHRTHVADYTPWLVK